MIPEIDYFINLKKNWRVSISAMICRCEALDVLKPQEAKRLHRQISKKGWRSYEPLDDEIEFEEPLYLREQVQKRLTVKNSIEIERFINTVRLPMLDMERLCSLAAGSFSEYYDAGNSQKKDGQLAFDFLIEEQ
jgi:hypothetical protein